MKVLNPQPEMTLGSVVDGRNRRAITAPGEYQRGRAWKPEQQKVLVDSVLRGYPLPRFYFSLERVADPLGNQATTLSVIDGLQRVTAFADYFQDKWPLLDPATSRSRFPKAIADAPCPWADRRFSELPVELQDTLRELALPVVVIEEFDSMDELRDLFIRLQAGTALTRQQIRDAWPGAMSPYIERIAGKLTSRGRFEFLSRLDRRGSRRDDEDELEDPFHDGRQTAAQLLRLFLDRKRGLTVGGVDARALDDLYHSGTDFDAQGELAIEFERLLGYAKVIVDDLAPLTTGAKKSKVSKLRLFTLFLTLIDLEASPRVRADRELERIGRAFWAASWFEATPSGRPGKATSRATIDAHFRWFATSVMSRAGVAHLDARRAFSESEREQLWERAAGVCELCGNGMTQGEAEYDHIVPWIHGGATAIDNGRAVHRFCNRSRRLAALDEAA